MTRAFRLLLFTLAALLPSVQLLAQTTVTGSILSDGVARDYRLYVPAAYQPGTPVPLLLNLHGYGSNAVEQEQYGDFRGIADTANFLVLHPNGLLMGTSRAWNTFTAPSAGGVDDVAFLSALIDSIRGAYDVDTTRIYSTGMSNGGFMSYELACQLSGRIAAVASVTGSMATSHLAACNPEHPTPILEIHGTADGTVPYQGNLLFAPVPAVLNYWVQYNQCAVPPVITLMPNINTTDNSTAERQVWSGGRGGSVVEHYRIIGGGHTWPGAPINIGVTNRDINASVEVWRFLRRYQLNRLTLGVAPGEAPAVVTVTPNPVGDAGALLVSGERLRAAQVSAWDVLGRAVPGAVTATPSGDVRVETGGWAPGVYVVRVATGAGVVSRRVVK